VLITDQTGRGVSGSYDVAFTLSTDADISTTGDNIDAGTQSIAAGSETVVTIDVPAAVPDGTYTLFGVLDTEDAAENNNLSSITAVVGATNRPDLEISVGSTPFFVDPGSTGTVGYAVENTGYAKVASGTSFTVRFRVLLSGAYVVFGEDTVTLEQDLNPHERVIRQFDVNVPTLEQMADDQGVTTTELDVFWINYEADVDSGDTVPEIIEGDTDTFAVPSGNRKPDLVMDDIVLPNDFVGAKIGGPVELTLKIINDGIAASGEYGIDLYVDINGDDAYDAGTDFMIHQWEAADTPVVPYDLSVSGHNVVFVNPPSNVTYPSGIPPGTYSIRAEITTTIDEYDDTNNGERQSLVDFVDELMNLSMRYMSTSLSAAIDEAAGGTIPLSFVIENGGEDAVDTDFNVTFYASENELLHPPVDIVLGTHTVTELVPAGGVLSQSFNAAFPAGEGAEFYTLYWDIDSGGAIDETDEWDNQPTSPEKCFVFPLVSDGVADIAAKLLLYKPYGSTSTYTGVTYRLYDDAWNKTHQRSLLAIAPGDEYTLSYSPTDWTLETGKSYGFRLSSSHSEAPVSFRLVPEYVGALPPRAIPTVASWYDPYEPNDVTGTAYHLSASDNPLFGFGTCWLGYSVGDYDDFFTFDVP